MFAGGVPAAVVSCHSPAAVAQICLIMEQNQAPQQPVGAAQPTPGAGPGIVLLVSDQQHRLDQGWTNRRLKAAPANTAWSRRVRDLIQSDIKDPEVTDHVMKNAQQILERCVKPCWQIVGMLLRLLALSDIIDDGDPLSYHSSELCCTVLYCTTQIGTALSDFQNPSPEDPSQMVGNSFNLIERDYQSCDHKLLNCTSLIIHRNSCS